MTLITRELPVPFSILHGDPNETPSPEEFLWNLVHQSCNDFLSIEDFEILDGNRQLSQSAAAAIYKVRYRIVKIKPSPGQVYEGVVSSVVAGGARVSVPFSVFVRTAGMEISLGDRVSLRLIAAKEKPDGYLCVGQILD